MLGYGYIDNILSIVKYNHTNLDEVSLHYLIDSLSAIELYCDKT